MLLGTKCKNKQKMEKKFFPSFCRFLLFYGTRKNISKVLRSPKPPDTLARKLHLTAKITSIWSHSQYFPCCYRTQKKKRKIPWLVLWTYTYGLPTDYLSSCSSTLWRIAYMSGNVTSEPDFGLTSNFTHTWSTIISSFSPKIYKIHLIFFEILPKNSYFDLV